MDVSRSAAEQELAVPQGPAVETLTVRRGVPAPRRPEPDAVPELVRAILRDPVTLEPLPAEALAAPAGYLALRSGGLSVKNDHELEHFRRTFVRLSPEEKLYSARITSLPAPVTTEDTLVLDIGCGPYDCLSAMPGTHVFLDDLMNLYVEELGAEFGGTRVCARTELMPFADDSVDVVYSVNMIDHVDDMPATVKEIHRVLKPGGAVHCQTYWNSHPLLPTEPGVFDRYFLDTFVEPYFEIEHLRTFALGDPEIASTYRMDIAGMVLRKRPGTVRLLKPRDRYEDPAYLGPQSHVSAALLDMDAARTETAAEHIRALAEEPGYELHHELLTARLAVCTGDLGEANRLIKVARANPRVPVNPYVRLAVAEIETRRLQAAAAAARTRADGLAERLAAERAGRERAATVPAAPQKPAPRRGLARRLRRILRRVLRAVR